MPGRALFGNQTEKERAVFVRRIKAFSRVVLAFAIDAALGGFMTTVLHFWGTALPVAAVALCARGQARVSAVPSTPA